MDWKYVYGELWPLSRKDNLRDYDCKDARNWNDDMRSWSDPYGVGVEDAVLFLVKSDLAMTRDAGQYEILHCTRHAGNVICDGLSGLSAVRENLIEWRGICHLSRVHRQAPYTNTHLTLVMTMYNKEMSEELVAVECLVGNITNYFKFIYFKKQMKVNLTAVGEMFFVCALLENHAHACVYVLKSCFRCLKCHLLWKNIILVIVIF